MKKLSEYLERMHEFYLGSQLDKPDPELEERFDKLLTFTKNVEEVGERIEALGEAMKKLGEKNAAKV